MIRILIIVTALLFAASQSGRAGSRRGTRQQRSIFFADERRAAAPHGMVKMTLHSFLALLTFLLNVAAVTFDPYYFFETDFGDSYQNLIAHVRRNHPDPSWLQLTFRRNQRFAQCMDFRFHLACIRYSASDLLAQNRRVLLAQAVNQRFGSAKSNAQRKCGGFV
jgi:hypothetical protein